MQSILYVYSHYKFISNDNILRTYQLSKCVPFPGTKLYEQVKNRVDEATLKTYTAYDGGQDTIMKAL